MPPIGLERSPCISRFLPCSRYTGMSMHLLDTPLPPASPVSFAIRGQVSWGLLSFLSSLSSLGLSPVMA